MRIQLMVGDDNQVYQVICGERPIQTLAYDSSGPRWFSFQTTGLSSADPC